MQWLLLVLDFNIFKLQLQMSVDGTVLFQTDHTFNLLLLELKTFRTGNDLLKSLVLTFSELSFAEDVRIMALCFVRFVLVEWC